MKSKSLSQKQKRANWDEYFMNIAKVVSTRSTCERKFVGAVIVRDKTILSTGYNGSIRKLEHCSEVGHMMENNHCVATIHAEANAIIQAAKNGVCIDGSTIYTTASPCWPCFKLIANTGIRRICFGEFYRDERIFTIAKKLKIELVKLENYMPHDHNSPNGLLKKPQMQGARERARRRYGNSAAQANEHATKQMGLFQRTVNGKK